MDTKKAISELGSEKKLQIMQPDQDTRGTSPLPDHGQRVPSLAAYQDLPDRTDSKSRSRILFSGEQLNRLREVFQRTKYPNNDERTMLAQSLGMTHKSVKQWFQNARSKVKKRGTDHVTGFYANKLAARKTQDSTSPTSFEYGRFKIPTVQDMHESDVKTGDSAPTSAQQATKHMERMIAKSPRSENTTESEEEESDVRFKASEPSGTNTVALSLNGIQNISSKSTKTIATISPRGMSPKEGTVSSLQITNATFQQMQQVALPADHPFCNLGNPHYVWSDETGSASSKRTTPLSVCNTDHDSNAPCQGETCDDILADYISRTSFNTVSKTAGSPGSWDLVQHARKRHRTQSGDVENRKSKRCRSSSSNNPIARDTGAQVEPLDLSIKKTEKEIKHERELTTKRLPNLHQQTNLIRPLPLPSGLPFFPHMTSLGYPFHLYPFGIMPAGVPLWYK